MPPTNKPVANPASIQPLKSAPARVAPPIPTNAPTQNPPTPRRKPPPLISYNSESVI